MRASGEKSRRAIRVVVVNLLVLVALLVFLEGTASLVLFAWRILQGSDRTTMLAEKIHTRYDPELGWSHVPSGYFPDMYGSGRHLTTNEMGFRAEREFSPEEPEGRVRVICSGDSFTLGYGVDDSQSWCERLRTIEPAIEPVNMGQGGYGFGQAYLWYARDGHRLEHSLHLFGFITDDFLRARRTEAVDYERPRLVAEDGELRVRNVPVPRTRRIFGYRRSELRQLARRLRLVELSRGAWRKLAGGGVARQGPDLPDPAAAEVVALVLDSLEALNERMGSALVLVHLPTEEDLEEGGSPATTAWKRVLERRAGARGIPYVYLAEDLEHLSREEVSWLFIQRPIAGLTASAGHYTAHGNAVMAERLYERLLAIPRVADRLPPARRAPPLRPTVAVRLSRTVERPVTRDEAARPDAGDARGARKPVER